MLYIVIEWEEGEWTESHDPEQVQGAVELLDGAMDNHLHL